MRAAACHPSTTIGKNRNVNKGETYRDRKNAVDGFLHRISRFILKFEVGAAVERSGGDDYL